jgi:uncharacterized membrane protein
VSGARKIATRRKPADLGLRRLMATVRRAFVEFLRLPLAIVAGFVLLAAGAALLDHSGGAGALEPVHAALRRYFFRNSESTSGLLGTIAGSVITVTSITFSLLLLAVQQAATALTPQVYDQFLRRRVNQLYFGFFVGLALYTLVILASVDRPYNPVFGAALALVGIVVALMLMILLRYTTINQMRPVVVIDAIHDHVLLARRCQREWLARTRSTARMPAASAVAIVRAEEHGYVVGIDVAALAAIATPDRGEVEIVVPVSLGTFIAFGDVLAEIRATALADRDDAEGRVRQAIRVEQQRDLDTDPGYGIEQLAIIAWTSVSTAKSNPAAGLLVLHSLRDLMARWSADDAERELRVDAPEARVVYVDDVFARLLDAFETIAVVASESIQPQTMAEIARSFAVLFDRLPEPQRARAEDVIERSLAALGDHVLTAELQRALGELVDALRRAGRSEAAARVDAAVHALARSVGKLGSRATRAVR